MLSAAGKNSAAARLHDMDRFDGQVCWTSERTGGAYSDSDGRHRRVDKRVGEDGVREETLTDSDGFRSSRNNAG